MKQILFFKIFNFFFKTSISIIFVIFTVANSNAAERRAATHISFGQYISNDGDDTVAGSRISVRLIVPFTDLLSYYIKLSNGSATGKHTNSDNTETEIKSSHTDLGSGLQIDFDLTQKNEYLIFLGSGIIAQNYQYDYEYPDSKTGTTSGVGYGYTAYTGLKFRPSKNFVIIPSYHYEQVTIKSETGQPREVTTDGFSLALAVGF